MLIRMEDLLEFAKSYDGNGENSYPENCYEGYSFIREFCSEYAEKYDGMDVIDFKAEFPYHPKVY